MTSTFRSDSCQNVVCIKHNECNFCRKGALYQDKTKNDLLEFRLEGCVVGGKSRLNCSAAQN